MHAVSTLFSISGPNWNSNVMPCPRCLTNKRLQSSMDKLPSCDDGYSTRISALNDGNERKESQKELVRALNDGNENAPK
jgi:uncharacterized membrane protein